MFNQYPYINEQDLNLDYILRRMKNLEETVAQFVALETVTFADPIKWNITSQYPKSTIVLDNTGNAYISKQAVPAGVQLSNTDYWLEIFNFTAYIKAFDSNLTYNIEQNTERASKAYIVGDWLLLDDILYKVIAAISADELFVIDTNIERFTVEEFIKAWIQYANGLIVQYKNDIDASELAYRNQLALDISNTTASLQAQLDLAIAGATVDSEVINARLGADGVTYPTLGDAIRTQISNLDEVLREQNTASNISIQNRHKGYISGSQWASIGSNSYNYAVIPVHGGETIKVTNKGSASAGVAALKTYTTPTTGDTVDFSDDADWNALKTIGTSTKVVPFEGTLPSDANYLYVYLGNASFNRRPTKCEIDGFDYSDSLVGNLQSIETHVDNLDSIIFASGIVPITNEEYIHDGYINSDTQQWTSIGSSTYHYSIIPVKPFDMLEVTANSSGSTSVAVLTAYPTPYSGDSPSFSADSNWSDLKVITTGNSFGGVLPSDAAYLYVYHGNFNRTPEKLAINGFDRLRVLSNNLNNNVDKVRIMQNNVGHFNMGQSLSGDAQYLTNDNVDDVIDAYKNMYGFYMPDILGLEEFEDSRDVYNAGVVVDTISTDSDIFDFLYPYKYTYTGLSSAPALKSKYPIVNYERLNYPYSYVHEGVTVNANQRAIYAHLNVNDKCLAVMVCAFPSGVGAELIAKRAACIAEAINLMVNDEYAVIICDENNGGVASSTTIDNSVAESLDILDNVLTPAGWSDALGAYFKCVQTWESTNTSYVSSVDNILFKDNGRVSLSGVSVLSNLYSELLSDHYPIYTDLLLK